MNYGILFSQELQKRASIARGLVTAPLLGLGLLGGGIDLATMGLIKGPNIFEPGEDELYDKSVVDQVIRHKGQYWSPKGTDVGAPVIKKHLMHNVPISLMNKDMDEVKYNQYLDRQGILSKQMQDTGEGMRFRPGGFAAESAMMSQLSPIEQKILKEKRFENLKRTTGGTFTPHMAAGAEARLKGQQS